MLIGGAGELSVIKRTFDGIGRARRVHTGEIQAQDKIGIAKGRRMPFNGQISENVVKFVFAGNIVIMFQHRVEQALAESAGADEKHGF